jgi:RNA polymerase sigma-70 factor (ECF subfamily)
MARDPRAGQVLERAAYRALPQPRTSTLSAPATTPLIPSQPSPVEPAGEQLGVMALVEAAQNGDGEAFGQLYDRYADMVHRYIAYRVGGNHTLAEDLTSETFLRALRRITSFTWQGRDFGAWLVTIARNLIADHFKSSRFRLEHSTSDLIEAGADRTEDGPEDEVLTGITNATLLGAVKQLGKNEGAIKALQYRAVKALARLLPQELVA